MARLSVTDTPDWLREFLTCPECKGAMWLTTSGGMSCRACPGHTGMIPEFIWRERVTAQHALVYAQNRTTLKPEEALWLANKWLEKMRQWNTKPVSQEGEKK